MEAVPKWRARCLGPWQHPWLLMIQMTFFCFVCLFHASKQLRYLTKMNRIQLNEQKECRPRMALGRKQQELVPRDLLQLGASQWPRVTKSETEIQLLGGSRAALALTCERAFSTHLIHADGKHSCWLGWPSRCPLLTPLLPR